MDAEPRMSREAYVAALRHELQELLGQVADVINAAPAGRVIAASEGPVRDLFAQFRQQAYEVGLQMRTDAAEAAFPPSTGRDDAPAQAE